MSWLITCYIAGHLVTANCDEVWVIKETNVLSCVKMENGFNRDLGFYPSQSCYAKKVK